MWKRFHIVLFPGVETHVHHYYPSRSEFNGIQTVRKGNSSIVTIRDVASLAGVSLGTASRVLSGRGYASKSTQAKVLEAARTLGYSPNQLARNLKRMQSETVGLLITDIVNPFYADLANGVLNNAQKLGYHVIVCATNEDEGLEDEYLRVLIKQRAAGIIAVPASNNLALWKEVQGYGIQLILVDREVEGLEGFDLVKVDNEEGAKSAVAHLISLGHERIGMINGSSVTTTARERLRGYLAAHEDARLTVQSDLIMEGGFKRSAGVEAAQHLLNLADPPTAIFAANNQLGEAAYEVIQRTRRCIPDDISLVIFDDVLWTSIVYPSITVIRQPTYQIGHTGMDLLHQRLLNKSTATPTIDHRITLNSTLVQRGSCTHPHH